jgi:anti-sigma factor RsiW
MTDDAIPPAQRAQLAIDGELDAARLIAYERDLALKPELAAEHARLLALSEAIRAHAPREAAPESLRARIEAMAAPARPARRAPWSIAAGLAFAVALGAGLLALRASSGRDATLDALVAGYQRAALAGQPFDVASSDRHTVKPWLTARAPLGALVLDLADVGYPLAGGRIDLIDGRPAPTLVYRRREHFISVTELPLSQAGGDGATREGYHILRWRDGERAYVAISDIDSDELAGFVGYFRAKAAG